MLKTTQRAHTSEFTFGQPSGRQNLESTKYLIVGGGIASVSACKGIRAHDTTGRVLLLSADSVMPYDRPPLSKDFIADEAMTHDDVSSKYDHWYDTNNIEVRLGTTVKDIDRRKRFVVLADGSQIEYEKLLLATGSRPRHLSSDVAQPGAPVHVLRTYTDAVSLRDAIDKANNILVIGTGFLGPEVASQCAAKGKSITLLGKASHIWDKFASPALGKFLNQYYESHGVKVLMDRHVTAIFEDRFITGDETFHACDLVLTAVGVVQNYELAEKCGIGYLPDDGIRVDEFLRSIADPDIFAAGDVAFFRDFVMDKQWHLEHHLNAQWQGEVAGANMAGAEVPYEKVPYFFSDFFDLHMILRGASETTQYTTVFGSFDNADFIELYADPTGFLKMGIAISRDEKKLDPISDRLDELIRKKAMVKDLSPADFEVVAV